MGVSASGLRARDWPFLHAAYHAHALCASRQSRTSHVLSNRQRARHLRIADRSFLAVLRLAKVPTTAPPSRTSAASIPRSWGPSAYVYVSQWNVEKRGIPSRRISRTTVAGRLVAQRIIGTE